MRTSCLALAVLSFAAPLLCAADKPDPRVVEAQTRFGLQLYAELAKADAGKNVFISPTSIAMALTMTWNGADGGTRDAMAKALGIDGLDAAVVNGSSSALLAALADPDPKVRLSIANSLWARKGIPFVEEFMKTNAGSFQAQVEALDFGDPASLARINGWIEQKTQGKIPKMLDRIPSEAILYLVNAVYFKGTWKTQFEKGDTTDQPFTLADGTKKDVPMMAMEMKMRYLRQDGFQAVVLPYGGGRVNLYVFLPDEGTTLASFQERLTAEAWETWMKGLGREREVDLWLPRFKSEYKADLGGPLAALGMGEAFRPEAADFRRMTPLEPTCISQVLHQSVVEVNEEGTEAAAATTVQVHTTSVPPPPATVHCDRPFFYAIRDDRTGTTLFLGSLVEP